MKRYLIYLFLALSLGSCEELFNLTEEKTGLTEEEIVNGLKTALEIGTDTATSVLSVVNGYYGNPLMKIPLPENAQLIREKIVSIKDLGKFFNLDDKFEDVIKSINKAAEEAAKEAAPIFKNTIQSMSIMDAFTILKGTNPLGDTSLKSINTGFDSTAATAYFKVKTYDTLVNLYAPKINNALNEDLGLGFSANQAWSVLTGAYNDAIDLINSSFLTDGLDEQYNLPAKMTDDLGEFSTKKALTGLFLRVGDEEKKIRENPFQWAVDIIQKVFGYIKDNPEG